MTGQNNSFDWSQMLSMIPGFGGQQQNNAQQPAPQDQGGGNPFGWLTNLLMPVMLIVGLIFIVPKLFNGEINLGEMFGGLMDGIGNLFGMGGDNQQQGQETGYQPVSYTQPGQSQNGPSQGLPFDPTQDLSYANEYQGQEGREFPDAAAYQGKVRIPQDVIAAAEGRGEKYVYGMVTVDAGNNDGLAVARGFHVFHDIENGTTELIPFVSGGATSVANVNDSRAVEATKRSVMPFLVTDDTGAGDGIHRESTISQFNLSQSGQFDFFVEYEDGVAHRGGIGSHNNFNHDEKGGRGSSLGCPVVRPEDVDRMIALFQQSGVAQGSTYYIFDPNEVIMSPQQVAQQQALQQSNSSIAPSGNNQNTESPPQTPYNYDLNSIPTVGV